MPDTTSESYEVTYPHNQFSFHQNEIITLLGNFFRDEESLTDALELAFEYVRKVPEHVPELIYKIREEFIFDREDEGYEFERQGILFALLIPGLRNKDTLYTALFYELAKTFLEYTFQHVRGGRKHDMTIYRYSIPNIPSIQEIRREIWTAIGENYRDYPQLSFNVLKNYKKVRYDISKEILLFDLKYWIEIVENHLTPDDLQHCIYVEDQIKQIKKKTKDNPKLSGLAAAYHTPDYILYTKLHWERLGEKEMYEVGRTEAFEKTKNKEIRETFVFNTDKEINDFYEFFDLYRNIDTRAWFYDTVLDRIIDENLRLNFETGCRCLQLFIEKNCSLDYIPQIVFRNHLNTFEKAELSGISFKAISSS